MKQIILFENNQQQQTTKNTLSKHIPRYEEEAHKFKLHH